MLMSVISPNFGERKGAVMESSELIQIYGRRFTPLAKIIAILVLIAMVILFMLTGSDTAETREIPAIESSSACILPRGSDFQRHPF